MRSVLEPWVWTSLDRLGALRPFRRAWSHLLLDPPERRMVRRLSPTLRQLVERSVASMGVVHRGYWRIEASSDGRHVKLQLLPHSLLLDWGDGLVGPGTMRITLKFSVGRVEDGTCIRRPPGWRLRRLAEDVYSRKIYENVLEPTLNDLQFEYQLALAEGRISKARWVQLRGYYSFWSTVVALALAGWLSRLIRLWKILRLP